MSVSIAPASRRRRTRIAALGVNLGMSEKLRLGRRDLVHDLLPLGISCSEQICIKANTSSHAAGQCLIQGFRQVVVLISTLAMRSSGRQAQIPQGKPLDLGNHPQAPIGLLQAGQPDQRCDGLDQH